MHALLPTKKPQPHRRRSVGSSNEYSLSQVCGHQQVSNDVLEHREGSRSPVIDQGCPVESREQRVNQCEQRNKEQGFR